MYILFYLLTLSSLLLICDIVILLRNGLQENQECHISAVRLDIKKYDPSLICDENIDVFLLSIKENKRVIEKIDYVYKY